MRLYPASPTARRRTLTRDLAALALLVIFAWTGVQAHDAIAELAAVGRGIQDSGRAISTTTRNTATAVDGAFDDAANAVDGIPLVGSQLGGTLRRAPASATSALRTTGDEQGSRVVRLGVEQVNRTETAADWVGWLMFGLPALVLLAWFLPGRIRLVGAMSTAQRTLSDAPEHILAARAAYSLPYKTLRRYTRDPFGDLAAGRHDALVSALRQESGLP